MDGFGDLDMSKKTLRTAALAQGVSCVAIILGSGLAVAQEASPPEDANRDVVVVIGTNIRGYEVVGSATDVIDSGDIAEQGKATIEDMLRELPANFAGGVAKSDNSRGGQDTSSAGSNLTAGAGINLRGLGSLSTLVLVNGRRVAVSGQFGDFVDISNIPVAAISRIEILQDGASAVYGSDAVGGVVNFVLKRDFEGVEALVRAGTTTQGGGTEFQASAIFGDAWDNGNIVALYEYNRRSHVSADDRNFNGGNFSDRGGVNWPIYTSRAGSAANIFSGGASFSGAVAYTVPAGPGTGLTVGQLNPAVGGFGNSFDPWAAADILPSMERHSLYVSLDTALNESLDLYGDARFSHREGSYRQGFAANFGTMPSTNPAYIAGNANNFGVLIDDVVLSRDVGVDSYAAQAGLRQDLFGDWVADFTVSYSLEAQSRYSRLPRETNAINRLSSGAVAPSSIACSLMGLNSSNIGSIVSPTLQQSYCASLGYGTWNPYSTQAVSPNVLTQLIGYEDLTFDSQVVQTTAKVDGTLFDLPGGAVKFAAGADYRVEEISGNLNVNYISVTPTSVPYGKTEQRVTSVFGELAIPIVGEGNAIPGIQALDVSLAVRYEESTGLKDFDTTNPKVGFSYEPFDGLKFRGSWGTSFHAPPMRFQYNGRQPVPGGNAIFYANAFYTAPCNTTLVQLNSFSGTPGGSGNCTFTGMIVSGGAGPVLDPETAETWSFGFEFAPEGTGFRANANLFNIEIEDRLIRITSGTLAGILANYFATGSSPYINNLVFNPSATLVQSLFDDPRFNGLVGPGPTRTPAQIQGIIYATQTNLAALKMEGVDIGLGYTLDTDTMGEFDFYFDGTLVTKYDVQGTPVSAFVDKLGLYESTGNPVEFKSRQGVRWSGGPLDIGISANYVSSYECVAGCFVPSSTGAPVANTAPVKIDSWITVDLQAGYDLSDFGGLFEGSRVTLNVLNALDEEPPFIDTGRVVNGNAPEPYDAANSSIIGRTVAVTISKSF